MEALTGYQRNHSTPAPHPLRCRNTAHGAWLEKKMCGAFLAPTNIPPRAPRDYGRSSFCGRNEDTFSVRVGPAMGRQPRKSAQLDEWPQMDCCWSCETLSTRQCHSTCYWTCHLTMLPGVRLQLHCSSCVFHDGTTTEHSACNTDISMLRHLHSPISRFTMISRARLSLP